MAYKNESAVYTVGGIGFLDALTLLFVALKLCGVIDWSWWWVLSPFLFQFGLVAIVVVIVLVVLIVKVIAGRW